MIPSWIVDVDRVSAPAVVSAAGKAAVRFFAWSAHERQEPCKACGLADSPHSRNARVAHQATIAASPEQTLRECEWHTRKKELRASTWCGEIAVRGGLAAGADGAEDLG
jgi:hypothetical protein